MKLRISLARRIMRLGLWLQSIAILVMRPDDLIEFNRQTYSCPQSIEGWSSAELLKDGLYPEEKQMIDYLPHHRGKMLLLGVGGGREVLPFAGMGYQITGVDFVPGMVAAAQNNALENGFQIQGLVQEITKLDIPQRSYDVIWLSAAMYSSIPTSKRRVSFLKQIHEILVPGGYFLTQFSYQPGNFNDNQLTGWKRLVALLTLGYLEYEPGDTLKHQNEYIHHFANEAEVLGELRNAEFELIALELYPNILKGGVVLQKSKI